MKQAMSLGIAGHLSQQAQSWRMQGQPGVLQLEADSKAISYREGRGTLFTRVHSDRMKGNRHE